MNSTVEPTEVTEAEKAETADELPQTTPLDPSALPFADEETEEFVSNEEGLDTITGEEAAEPVINDLAKTEPLDASTLPKETSMPPIRPNENKSVTYEPSIHFAQRCDVGVVRSRNEDSSYAFVSQAGGQQPLLPFALCLVADGMGGHHAGHEASRLVSREVVNHVMTRIYLPLIQGKPAAQSIQEVMEDAVREANRA
ncbi:MAG: hypothetical protein KDE51_05865, partial [Anaerolineales bacterium]|nr:hypothetical protein [Anaerolineales bacterium]